MKIDLHCHTKKCKTGDGENRNIDSIRFIEKMKQADVGVSAITNHNSFDLNFYNELVDLAKDELIILPGIELDIIRNNNRSHLIIIGDKDNADNFSSIVAKLIKDKKPDDVLIKLEDLCDLIKDEKLILIAHAFGKKPCISEEDYTFLSSNVGKNITILREVQNLISAGILMAHGINVTVGSDVKDWNSYVENSKNLPELTIPIDSFDNLALLIKRDENFIKTFINKKKKEEIEIKPFGLEYGSLSLPIYNDVNIIFGGKGTGKTVILKAIEGYFNAKQANSVSSYYCGNNQNEYNKITKYIPRNEDLSKICDSPCRSELEDIKN